MFRTNNLFKSSVDTRLFYVSNKGKAKTMANDIPLRLERVDLTNLWTMVSAEDTTVIVDLLMSFQESTEYRLQKMEVALQKGNVSQLVLEAHTLKSSSHSLGAARLAMRCQQFARQVKTTPIAQMMPLFDSLRQEHRLVIDDLETVLAALLSYDASSASAA